MPTSTVLIEPPPKETAFVDGSGRITAPWITWLSSITAAGVILQTVSVNQSIAEDNSTDGTAADVLDTALDAAALLAPAGASSDITLQIADALSYATEPLRPILPLLEEILARLIVVESPGGRDTPPASDAVLTADPQASGWVQRCDELAAQIAAGDPAPFGALGSAAFQASTAFDAAGLAAAAQAASDPLGAASAAQTAAQTFAANASNLSSGTVAAARLPVPSATTLGGVQSLAAVASKWINTISTAGVPTATQPAFTDISGTIATGQVPTLNQSTTGTAANVTGVVAIANGGTGRTTAALALAALVPAWTSYTPTVTGGGSMTVSGLTVTDAQYVTIGPLTHFKVFVTFTTGGTANPTVSISLPVAVAGGSNSAASMMYTSSVSWSPGCAYVAASSASCFMLNNAVWFIGGINLMISGTYRTT